jgi:hypothetical protein
MAKKECNWCVVVGKPTKNHPNYEEAFGYDCIGNMMPSSARPTRAQARELAKRHAWGNEKWNFHAKKL